MKVFQFELTVKDETIFYNHSGEDGCTLEEAKAVAVEAICEYLIVSEEDIVFVSQREIGR